MSRSKAGRGFEFSGLPPELSWSLRGWALLSALAGTSALALSGLVSVPVAGFAALAVVAGSIAAQRSARESAETAASVGWVRAGGLVVAGVVLALTVVQAAPDGALAVTPGLALAMTVLQSSWARTTREARLVLLLGFLLLLAALGLAPEPSLVAPLVVIWVAVLVGLVRSAGPPGITRARVSAAFVVAGVVGLVGFLVLPRPDVDTSAARGALGSALGQQTVNRSAQAYAGGALDLNARGDLPDTPLVAVPADSPAYWRAGSLDTWTGSGWTSREAPVSWTANGTQGRAGFDTAPGEGSSTVERSDAVRVLGRYTALLAPGAVTGVRDVAANTPPVSAAGVTRLTATSTYTVRSLVPPLVGAPVSAPGTGPGPGVGPGAGVAAGAQPADVQRYTALPATVPQRVRDLGRSLVAGAPDRSAAVRAVEVDLRARALYSLDAPVPARGSDAVDAFLFVDRVGFCEQFASAEVLLLRAAGIPARVATGFAGGTPAGGQRVLLAADAHAWVEVWIAGQGWTTSDPTAGARTPAQAGPWWQRVWLQALEFVTGLLADTRGRLLAALAVVLTAGIVVAVLVLLGHRRRRERSDVTPVGGSGRRDVVLGPLLGALAAYDAAAARQGLGRGPAEGLGSWAGRLEAAGRGRVAVAVRSAEVACYARVAPQRRELHEALATLESSTSEMLGGQVAVGPGGGPLSGG